MTMCRDLYLSIFRETSSPETTPYSYFYATERKQNFCENEIKNKMETK